MSIEQYVAEDGRGPYAALHVPDSLPARPDRIRMLMVFESPHLEEVDAGVPVVGDAGRLALDYLLDGRANGQSLGRAIGAGHAAGNERIAILNVCNVPLQEAGATGPHDPGFTHDEWAILNGVRTSDAKTATSMMSPVANRVGATLLAGIETRVNSLHLAPDAVIVAAGGCAKRFMRSFTPSSGAKTLGVPHPSRRGWQRAPVHPGLLEVQRLYAMFA